MIPYIWVPSVIGILQNSSIVEKRDLAIVDEIRKNLLYYYTCIKINNTESFLK